MTVPPNGFEGLLQDLLKAMGSTPSAAWFEAARALAVSVVNDEQEAGNLEPVVRIRLEELAGVVARHVTEELGDTTDLRVEPVTRASWAVAALTSWRARLEPLVAVSADAPAIGDDENPTTAMLARFAGAMGPMFLGLQVGSTAGHLAERALGSSAFPLPWPGSAAPLVVVRNIDEFSTEWSLDRDAVTVFTIARELTAHAVYERPDLAARMEALLSDATTAQMDAQRSMLQRLGDAEHPEDLAQLLSSPEEFLDGLPGFEGLAGGPAHDALNAAVTALSAYFDEVARRVGERVVGNVSQLVEAWHRHRVGDSKGVENAGALFGIDLSRERVELGRAFVSGVIEREGFDALARLTWSGAALPTAAEIVAPGLWLARTELPGLGQPSED